MRTIGVFDAKSHLSELIDAGEPVTELAITVDDEVMSLFGAEARVAARYGISVYDAAYLNWSCAGTLRSRLPMKRLWQRHEPQVFPIRLRRDAALMWRRLRAALGSV